MKLKEYLQELYHRVHFPEFSITKSGNVFTLFEEIRYNLERFLKFCFKLPGIFYK